MQEKKRVLPLERVMHLKTPAKLHLKMSIYMALVTFFKDDASKYFLPAKCQFM